MKFVIVSLILALVFLTACTSKDYYADFDFSDYTEACPTKDDKDEQSRISSELCGIEMKKNCEMVYMFDYGDDKSPTWLHILEKEGDVCVYSLYHKGKLTTQQCWIGDDTNNYVNCP